MIFFSFLSRRAIHSPPSNRSSREPNPPAKQSLSRRRGGLRGHETRQYNFKNVPSPCQRIGPATFDGMPDWTEVLEMAPRPKFNCCIATDDL
jgi:hypothetical protein